MRRKLTRHGFRKRPEKLKNAYVFSNLVVGNGSVGFTVTYDVSRARHRI